MAKGILVILLLGLCLSSSCDGVDEKTNARKDLLDQIDTKLKLLNKPAVKSIKSEDGDIIDCVDIYKQPAFDHPALKNHSIQMKPSFQHEDEVKPSGPLATQIWQKSGSCPEGTVPIRRTRKEDLLRANSIEEFGRKPVGTGLSHFVDINKTKVDLGPEDIRSVASIVSTGLSYIGAQADINVWNPSIDLPDDFTTGQIWAKAGTAPDVESIETGWMVNPKFYGDKQTRFFVYWTKDLYQKTGCFDLSCSGFVQTGHKYALGAAFLGISAHSGTQYHMTARLRMDVQTGNWWLRLYEEDVGYWPQTLFDQLKRNAIFVQYGGDVYSTNVKKTPHTKTQMGSGEFADTLYSSAAFIKNLRIMDYSLTWKYPPLSRAFSEEPYCYSSINHEDEYTSEPIFFFGGPGQNFRCP